MIAPSRKKEDGGAPHDSPPAVVVDIGNTSISIGLYAEGGVTALRTFDSGVTDEVFEGVLALAGAAVGGSAGVGAAGVGTVPTIVIASVASRRQEDLTARIRNGLDVAPLVVGMDIPLPAEVDVLEPEKVGVDRVCAGAAAYELRQSACVVVDFGTAVTIDVMDDRGVFLGGAILPGLRMQAWALANQTSALPEVTLKMPEVALGRDTESAILSGIMLGTVGAVRHMIEAYSTEFGTWLPAVATGGSAVAMAEACEVFDAVVPELCLLGVGLAHRKWLERAVSL